MPDHKAQLLHHYRKPKGRVTGALPSEYLTAKGANPACGDEIEIGILLDASQQLKDSVFRARGCSICIASASILMHLVEDLQCQFQLKKIQQDLSSWLTNNDASLPNTLPSILSPLEAIKSLPARRKCVLLVWDALSVALEKTE